MHTSDEPSVGDPAKDRRPESRNEHADADIVTHNTLSTDITHVEVFYPFHPLHGYRLRVLRRPAKSDGAVTVADAMGKRLKIPTWMLSPAASNAEIVPQACLSRDSLLSLVTLLKSTRDKNRANLLRTSVDVSKGGRDAAAATAKPGSNRRGTCSRRSGA
ncbi:MAG: hypothetical protein JO108_20355 [Acidobacteriaceae bacterium]|nr:hypothetical protein [Acidobacteriaceae bacterium]